jgi:hypothetical protein
LQLMEELYGRMKTRSLSKLLRSTHAIACIVFICCVAIHVPFVLFDSFGEQDAARIASSAVYGFEVGNLRLGKQWPFSCPLYIHGLYLALRVGLTSPSNLILAMALCSLIASAVFSAVIFIFFLKATQSTIAASAIVFVVQLCPFFWVSSLYGFPTIVSLALFMISATVFQGYFSGEFSSVLRILGFVAAWLIFGAAVFCKVDSVMASALFCLPVWQSQKKIGMKLLWTAALAFAAFITFWLFNQYGLSLSQYKDVGSHWKEWGETFYLGFGGLFSKENAVVIGRAAGIASMPAAALGAALSMTQKSLRLIALWVLLTFVPIMLVWSLIGGNSARHNLIPSVFASVLFVLPLTIRRKWVFGTWLPVLAVTLLANYYWFPASASTVKPSGRLIESAVLMRKSMSKYSRQAREITRLPQDKVLVVGPDFLQPYYYFEILASDHLKFVKKGGGKYVMKDGQTEKLFYLPPSEKRFSTRELEKNGFHVVRIER